MTAEIFKPWSEKEIQDYKEIRRKELDPVYIVKEIFLGNPESRVKYATDLLGKLGYNFEKDTVNVIACEKGKAKALVSLEETIIREFGGYTER